MVMPTDIQNPSPPPPGSVTPQWSIDPTAKSVSNGQSLQSSLLGMFNSQVTSASNASTTSLGNDGSTVISPVDSTVTPTTTASSSGGSGVLLFVAIAAVLVYVLGKGHEK